MNLDFSFIDHSHLQDIADAIRFVEGSTSSIAPSDYPNRIRALDKYIPDYSVLNFTMPNGGTISLNKTGSPAVVELEYWLDENGQWLIWQPDNNGNRSLTLTAGQRMYVRNTSETQTGFSTDTNKYYAFGCSDVLYAGGNINSLLCKIPQNIILNSYCFNRLFAGNIYLVSSPILSSEIVPSFGYASIFYGCSSLNTIRTRMTDISSRYCLQIWVQNVSSTGDFYCPAELTIPTGESGIPSNWTRHDLT